MSDPAYGGRYFVKMARGEGADHDHLQNVLDACPEGYCLHSITPFASGSGYTLSFIVTFEREKVAIEAGGPRTGPEFSREMQESASNTGRRRR
ncbi:hypothetical protein JQ594_15550 [Bradyrhizobium manausense]|uniref:hypothetical protein n=1 Tax=Bradyrhizobium manausense TaxID=989370 RepID=UPI001BACE3C3|nr:hypothetical protein [Bradyrhizobium manausense]MBR0687346.1 hypothetical protein [Bradyrhizobium manausense]